VNNERTLQAKWWTGCTGVVMAMMLVWFSGLERVLKWHAIRARDCTWAAARAFAESRAGASHMCTRYDYDQVTSAWCIRWRLRRILLERTSTRSILFMDCIRMSQ
jgi:hypothetical protein